MACRIKGCVFPAGPDGICKHHKRAEEQGVAPYFPASSDSLSRIGNDVRDQKTKKTGIRPHAFYVDAGTVETFDRKIDKWAWLYELAESMPEGKELRVEPTDEMETSQLRSVLQSALSANKKTLRFKFSCRQALDRSCVIIRKTGEYRNVHPKFQGTPKQEAEQGR